MEKMNFENNLSFKKYYDSRDFKGKLKIEKIFRISAAQISFMNLNENRSEIAINEYLETIKDGDSLLTILGYDHLRKTRGFNIFMLNKKGFSEQEYLEKELSPEDFQFAKQKKMFQFKNLDK